MALREKYKKQTKIWTTREGKKIRLCDMTDDHLVNTLNFLVKRAKERRADAIVTGWSFLNALYGEMAVEACEQEVGRIEDSGWDEWTPDIFENMKIEYQRRFEEEFKAEGEEGL